MNGEHSARIRVAAKASWLVLLCGAAGAARGSRPGLVGAAGEEAALAAVAGIEAQQGKSEARARVRSIASGLAGAGLARFASVALAQMSQDESAGPEVREAARSELFLRAAGGDEVALALLPGDAPRAGIEASLALRLARIHLERALVLSPPEEGSDFEPLRRRTGVGANATPTANATTTANSTTTAIPTTTTNPTPTVAADQPDTAPSPAERAAQEELKRARALAAEVPRGDRLEAEAREIAALSALLAGDALAAEREFSLLAALPVRSKAPEGHARRNKALLQLARLAYARGDDDRAQALYGRVSRSAQEWLDALFESSWSEFRHGEDEKALGNLLTLHAPFFQARYFPESFVLKALVLYENCRYTEARGALLEFQSRYGPLHDGLAAALSRLPSSVAAVEALLGDPSSFLRASPSPEREELARLLGGPDLHGALQAIREMGGELDSMDRRSPEFRRSPLARKAVPLLRAARLALMREAGDRVRARIARERSELRELIAQALRLDFEIAGREKELAAAALAGPPAPEPQTRRDAPQVQDDEELWPFQGEYWRDELGSYRLHLGARCAPEAPLAPVQEATAPQVEEVQRTAVVGEPATRAP